MTSYRSKILNIEFTSLVEKIKEINTDQLVFIVDKNIEKLYQNFLSNIREILGSHLIVVPEGELVKNFSCFEQYIEKILSLGIHRGSHLVAIGGGATSDFTGFLASSLLRGVEWSVIPTTLLSMIDASIGGKVAINSSHGKNLIGAFHKPQNIFISPDFLKTLDKKHMDSGLGELIKYGFLSKDISKSILENDNFTNIIRKCGEFKEELTIRDFKENGERKSLNLGHTLGHAFEKHFSLEHGIAVYHGLIAENKIFGNIKEIASLIETYSNKLNISIPKLEVCTEDIIPLLEYCFKDKKMKNKNELEFVLAGKIEDIYYPLVTRKELEEKLLVLL